MAADITVSVTTPRPIAIADVNSTSITVRWPEDNPLAIQYRLEGRDPDGTWLELETIYRGEGIAPGEDYHFTEDGLAPGQTRCYHYLVNDTSSPWPTSNEVCATTDVPAS
jgi:hypothetical protein